ncbi:MAG: GAF domain-containing protein [Phycisphaerae bacterium]
MNPGRATPPATAGKLATRPQPAVIFVCRDASRRALVERAVHETRTYSSAAEAFLAALRDPPRALLLNLRDVAARAADLLQSLRREQPRTPVYLVAECEDEPSARALADTGAADYFVLPGDLVRLTEALAPQSPPSGRQGGPPPDDRPEPPSDAPPAPPADRQPEPAPERPRPKPTSPEPPKAPAKADRTRRGPRAGTAHVRRIARRDPSGQWRLLEAAGRIARLALTDAENILAEGTDVILDALGVTRATVLLQRSSIVDSELVQALQVGPPPPSEALQAQRIGAEEVLRTGRALLARGPDAQGEGATLLLPLRERAEVFGVLCLSGKAEGLPITADDLDAAAPLVDAVACLYRAALHRRRYAGQVLCDPETALLAPEAFEECVEKLIDWAWEREAEVPVVLLEARPAGDTPTSSESLAQVGRAIGASVTKGRQAGRLGPALFAMAWSRRLRENEGYGEANAAYRLLADRLTALGPRVDAGLRLRAGVAVFPSDGDSADVLLAVAQERLATQDRLTAAT